MENPRISVIITAYNGGKFIDKAIRSVLGQTFRNLELIVVDDSSSDDTVDIVKGFALKDERVRLFVLDKNSGGPGFPRTVGVKKSQGAYFAFLDQDDAFMPGNLETKLKIFDEPGNENILIVNGYSWTVDNKTGKLVDYWPYSPINWLVKKKFLEDGGYFKSEQDGVDELGLWFRAMKKHDPKKSEYFVTEPQTLYFRHEGQNSSALHIHAEPQKFIERLTALAADAGGDDRFRNDLSRILSRLGNFYCLAGDAGQGRRVFSESLRLRKNFFSALFYSFSFLPHGDYEFLADFLKNTQSCTIWKIRLMKAKFKYEISYGEAERFLKKGKAYP
ncbi:MAG: glycosyltransferase family A protein [Minisyncoccia bacterium]